MRRFYLAGLAAGEFAVAGLLAVIAWQLPSTREVEDGFGRSERAARVTAAQLRLVREHIQDLRRPEMSELAAEVQQQASILTVALRAQGVDYDAVAALSDALGDVGDGLDGVAVTLDPARVEGLGAGLGTAADVIDTKITPLAEATAGRLERSGAAIKEQVGRLSTVIRTTPLDLTAARRVSESLGRFAEGLRGMTKTLPDDRLKTIRSGFDGLETSLTAAAGQVDRLAGVSYPSVTMNGFQPVVAKQKLWPEGGTIADGMRKAATGVAAAGQELDDLGRALPGLRASLTESVAVVEGVRDSLDQALKQQGQLEPLLKEAPAQMARLAEDLPRLAEEFARLLRDGGRLKEVSAALRQAKRGIDVVVARWPELRRTLTRSAQVLRATRNQLKHVLSNRETYESAQRQAIRTGERLSLVVPLYARQLGSQLEDQDRALGELRRSIDDVGDVIPVFGKTAAQVLFLSKMLLVLLAGLVAVHGSGVGLNCVTCVDAEKNITPRRRPGWNGPVGCRHGEKEPTDGG